MIHPDTEVRFVSEEIGVGVFARKTIPKGTIAAIQDDLDIVIPPEVFEALDPPRKAVILKFAYAGEGGAYVLCWDHARYLNHGAFPNLVSTPYGFELASRDILPGEELRFDYAVLYAGQDKDAPFTCAPEAGSTRARVRSDDYRYLYKAWDAAAREAFARFNHVDQPLRHLIRPDLVDRVGAVAAGVVEPDSYLSIFDAVEPAGGARRRRRRARAAR